MNCNAGDLRNLKIAYIGYGGLDEFSGMTAGLKNMLSVFSRLDSKISLISYAFYSDHFGIEHRKVDEVAEATTIHMPAKLPNVVKAFSVLPAFIYAWRPAKSHDLIFADLSTILTAFPAVILAKIFGKPVILDYVDEEFKKIPDLAYKYVIQNADLTFAISHYLMDKAKRYGCKSVVYLPAFVDTDLFNMDLEARAEVRRDLGIEHSIVIGYAGSFSPEEGLTTLLQAVKRLLNNHRDVQLIIIGGKKRPEEDDIPKVARDLNIENKVTVVPPQPHKEVPKLLSACDVLCCPKIDCPVNRAANPVKVVEYLSMGLPTVCSAVGGATYTIEDGIDGLLVKPGDVKDLEEKLEWIILNLERARGMGENGRRKAMARYSIDAIEGRIRQPLTRVMNEKTRASKTLI